VFVWYHQNPPLYAPENQYGRSVLFLMSPEILSYVLVHFILITVDVWLMKLCMAICHIHILCACAQWHHAKVFSRHCALSILVSFYALEAGSLDQCISFNETIFFYHEQTFH